MDFQQIFPVTDSIWKCFIVIALILFVPFISQRIRFPQIAGLILAGLLVGGSGLNIIDTDEVLSMCSKIGLLFIMFFAGLDIDIEEMKKTGHWGFIFGIITFAIPFGACYYSCIHILDMTVPASLIVGCIMGSHTLISYTIVGRYGLTKEPGVTIAVTGALVAILLALVINSFVRSAYSEHGENFSLWLFMLKFAIYISFIVYAFPKLSRTFFHRFGSGHAHFLFIFMMLMLSAGLASLIGLEGILGAFLAGLVTSRYIPQSSPLMNRIDFIGNTLFVPIFLLHTGMLINLKEIISNPRIIYLFGVIFAIGTVGKWLAALIIQKIRHLDKNNRRLIFGLSESHAAGALAITMGAYTLNLVDNIVLSTTIIIVLFSCIASNIITERAAISQQKIISNKTNEKRKEKLMVLVHNPATTANLMDTVMALRTPKSRTETVGLHITINGEHANKYMQSGKSELEHAASIAAAADMPFTIHNRLGNNIIDSIKHASEEYEATDLIMGLADIRNVTRKYYEDFILSVTAKNRQQTFFVRMNIPVNMIRRIVVIIPEQFTLSPGFLKSMEYIGRLGTSIGCSTHFYGNESTLNDVRSYGKSASRTEYYPISDTNDLGWIMDNVNKDHLLVLVGPREDAMNGIHPFAHLYEHIQSIQKECNMMLVFPESDSLQNSIETTQATTRTDRDLLKMLRM
ncbi:MAG: cation:proton antiporter [Bacteroidaceae bacterium]|nr:cation:proton antiporter [Bacteroidaceae bacterium]